jgi:hypothetical protein
MQRPTLEYRSTSVLLFLCWKSSKAKEKQVIFKVLFIFYMFYILCIFCIFSLKTEVAQLIY